MLAEAFRSHKQKSAGFEAYQTPNTAACHAAKTMPFHGGKETARGSPRLQVKDEYCTTWTVFTRLGDFTSWSCPIKKAVK